MQRKLGLASDPGPSSFLCHYCLWLEQRDIKREGWKVKEEVKKTIVTVACNVYVRCMLALDI